MPRKRHLYDTGRVYKLNQVQDAITRIVIGLQFPAEEVPSRLKRLRDADRAAGIRQRPAFPGAFQETAAGGRGNDAVLTPYDAFALWLGWSLLNLSYSQTQTAMVLRAHRPELEAAHRRILGTPASVLRLPKNFAPGRDAFEVSNPSFFVVNSGWREPNSAGSDAMAKIVDGEANLLRFLRSRVWSNSILELDQPALLLDYWLAETTPKVRGRG